MIFKIIAKITTYLFKLNRLSALYTLVELSCIPTSGLGSSLHGFFPGLCTHMLKIINGAIKQSHAVTKVL